MATSIAWYYAIRIKVDQIPCATTYLNIDPTSDRFESRDDGTPQDWDDWQLTVRLAVERLAATLGEGLRVVALDRPKCEYDFATTLTYMSVATARVGLLVQACAPMPSDRRAAFPAPAAIPESIQAAVTAAAKVAKGLLVDPPTLMIAITTGE